MAPRRSPVAAQPGAVRDPEPGVDGGRGVRQVPVAGHGQDGAETPGIRARRNRGRRGQRRRGRRARAGRRPTPARRPTAAPPTRRGRRAPAPSERTSRRPRRRRGREAAGPQPGAPRRLVLAASELRAATTTEVRKARTAAPMNAQQRGPLHPGVVHAVRATTAATTAARARPTSRPEPPARFAQAWKAQTRPSCRAASSPRARFPGRPAPRQERAALPRTALAGPACSWGSPRSNACCSATASTSNPSYGCSSACAAAPAPARPALIRAPAGEGVHPSSFPYADPAVPVRVRRSKRPGRRPVPTRTSRRIRVRPGRIRRTSESAAPLR
jgi:hypothetical protein